jgi:protein SCO1
LLASYQTALFCPSCFEGPKMVHKIMTEDKPNKARPPKIAIVLGLLSIVLGSAVAFGYLKRDKTDAVNALPGNCNSRAFAEIGGPFSLVNQDNVAVTDQTFIGKPTLIYFGFTYCPDICPMSLQGMALALDEARAAGGKNIDDIQPLLISIDPERDTPASLKQYVTTPGFPKGLVGLTGSMDQVTKAAKTFKVGFTKSVPKGSPAKDYTVDHTSIMYLMGRDGKLRSFFTNNPDPKEVGTCIAALSKAGL